MGGAGARSGAVRSCVLVTAMLAMVFAGGCSRFQRKPADKYVYVTAQQAYLVDRVAAVSNRVGNVSNGEKLVVLDRARHWVKVKTPQGQVGFIKEKDVATQETYEQFDGITKEHEKDPAIGTGTVRDQANLHLAPGRDTAHFFLLAEGDKVKLLSRATLPKVAPGSVAAAKPAAKVEPAKAGAKGAAADAAAPPPPAMEDWWLVRDTKGHTGWLLSRMMEVDAPETLLRYAEGQRIVGAYVLEHLNDPESGQLRDGQPDPDIPVYVTVLSPYKAGLPYDFDQVRVFTWNLKKHRYETAFREKNIEGYLPVTVKQMTDPYGHAPNSAVPLPAFTYRVLAAEAPQPVPDAVTGIVKPGKLVEKTYRLEGNITRRILAPGTQPPAEAHPMPEPEKKGAKKKGKR